MRAAKKDLSEHTVPDGLHARTVGMGGPGKVVEIGIVDNQFQLVHSGNEKLPGNPVDMGRGERIATAEMLAVKKEIAAPHHALEKQLHRMLAVRRGKLDGARPHGLPFVRPLLDECAGLDILLSEHD